jgi:protein involved in polysaccharide export with SLBB domain
MDLPDVAESKGLLLLNFASRFSFALALVMAGLTARAFAAVQPGDELNVFVYGHPELSGSFTVDAADRLSLPLAGVVNVRDLDLGQVAYRVRQALQPYVVLPAVDVQMKNQGTSLFISGGSGGVLKYAPGETLTTAVADLPSANQQAQREGAVAKSDINELQRSRIDLRRVGVTRDGRSLGSFNIVALSAAGDPGPALMPGDTLVLVNKPLAVRVAGDVARPGTAFLWTDEPLSDAIEQSGGILPSAATSNVVLTRSGTPQLLALGSPVFTAAGQSGDSIVVPTAPRVNVAGLVDKPGPVVLKTDFTLLNALYSAGGPTKWADLTKVQVLHDGVYAKYNITALTHGDASQNPTLKDGDTVFVPEGHKIDFTAMFQNIVNAVWLIK